MYEIKLYVVGRTPKSVETIEELVKLLEDTLDGHYHLHVIQVIERPEMTHKDKIMATPTLQRVSPGPVRTIVGDLSDKETVSLALGLTALQEEVKK